MKLSEFIDEHMLTDPEWRDAYDESELRRESARMLARARREEDIRIRMRAFGESRKSFVDLVRREGGQDPADLSALSPERQSTRPSAASEQ